MIFLLTRFSKIQVYTVLRNRVRSITTCLFHSESKRYTMNHWFYIGYAIARTLQKRKYYQCRILGSFENHKKLVPSKNNGHHMGQYCHSIYIGSNKNIFVTLHDIFMPNKTYSYHCIIYIYAYIYSFKNIYAYCACWLAELIRGCDAERNKKNYHFRKTYCSENFRENNSESLLISKKLNLPYDYRADNFFYRH